MPAAHLTAGRAVAAAPVRAEQRGGERPGRHRPAGPGRPGEQPGVRHARARLAAPELAAAAAAAACASCATTGSWPTRSAERPARRALPCHRHSTIAGMLPVFASAVERHRVGQHVPDPLLDRPAELARPAGWRRAPGSGRGRRRGQAQEPGPDPLVELGRLGFQPVRGPGPAAQPGRGRQVQQDGQVGHQPAGRPLVQPGHLADRQAAAPRPGRRGRSPRTGR